jgi:hypothetical protein
MNYYNYFTEIEEHFVKRRGKHLLISPMDWGLIAAWKDAGIPLQVAIRGIDIAMDSFISRQRRGSGKINSLCYCHDSVMEEFARHQESRIGESETKPPSRTGSQDEDASPDIQDETELKEAAGYLSAIIDEINTLSTEQHLSGHAAEGIGRVRERLEAMLQPLNAGAQTDLEALERDLVIADEILVDALSADVSANETAEWEKEAKSELKVYRKKLPKEMYTKIFNNYIRGKLHHKFNVREFSLFRL